MKWVGSNLGYYTTLFVFFTDWWTQHSSCFYDWFSLFWFWKLLTVFSKEQLSLNFGRVTPLLLSLFLPLINDWALLFIVQMVEGIKVNAQNVLLWNCWDLRIKTVGSGIAICFLVLSVVWAGSDSCFLLFCWIIRWNKCTLTWVEGWWDDASNCFLSFFSLSWMMSLLAL